MPEVIRVRVSPAELAMFLGMKRVMAQRHCQSLLDNQWRGDVMIDVANGVPPSLTLPSSSTWKSGVAWPRVFFMATPPFCFFNPDLWRRKPSKRSLASCRVNTGGTARPTLDGRRWPSSDAPSSAR